MFVGDLLTGLDRDQIHYSEGLFIILFAVTTTAATATTTSTTTTTAESTTAGNKGEGMQGDYFFILQYLYKYTILLRNPFS